MNIRFLTYRIFAFLAISMLAACSDDDNILPEEVDGVEMKGVIPTMTRAGTVAELEDYVGKQEFADKDRAVFVTIKRTNNPIAQFTYKDIEFVCAASTSAEGVKSIGWSRDKDKGTGGGDSRPDRIYWSDAINPHTFIGYCKPQQGSGAKEFDWDKSSEGVYYGSIGDPEVFSSEHPENNVIDFRSTFDSDGTETLSGNVELCKNDILLTNSTAIKANDAIAKLQFYHGLAQVRVIVNISDFAAGGGDDTKAIVSNMILKNMLMMYKWDQRGVATEALVSNDQEVINILYSGVSVNYEQRKNVNLWIPKPKGVGEKSSRTFTFYGLAVPTEVLEANPLNFSFNVTYPNPMKPTEMMTHLYSASIHSIRFDAGKCTTISISLNHKNEKMTIGAEYDDWEFIDIPDEGELKKNATFLASTERTTVTIIGDEKATVDDATWLYVDTKDNNKIKDIYGNDGSKAHPFQISTADQLLSFAYEVKGTQRKAVDYTNLSGTSSNFSAGGAFDFTNYYVALDAGITLQATEKKTKKELEIENPNIDKSSGSAYDNAPSAVLNWIGIGDTGKPFNGEFIGGVRLISRLNGKPFFIELGPNAHVDQLILEDVIEIDGDGGFAETNKGVICACKVDGNVSSQSSSRPVGSLVGTNSGLIFACYHIGDLTATSASVVGGLVGENTASGKIVASYNFGKITATGSYKYGVLGQGYTPDGQTKCNESVYGCFYDHTKASIVSNVAPEGATTTAFPSAAKSTVDMIRNSFAGSATSTEVTCLNGIINQWVTTNFDAIKETQGEEWANHFKAHYYVAQPANYPNVY